MSPNQRLTDIAALGEAARDIAAHEHEYAPDNRVVGIFADDLPSLVEALLAEGGKWQSSRKHAPHCRARTSAWESIDVLIRVANARDGAVVILYPRAVDILSRRAPHQDWHLRSDQYGDHCYVDGIAYPIHGRTNT